MNCDFSGKRGEYYERLKVLAAEIRKKYGIVGPRVTKRDMRRIYRDQGIQIDLWPYPTKDLRGAYFNDKEGQSVMIAKDLPEDPMIFTLGHELKHHLVDRNIPILKCLSKEASEPLEIGAEVFSAELLFPEEIFIERVRELLSTRKEFNQEILVRLKQETQTTLSYTGLRKTAIRLKFTDERMPTSNWRSIERKLYGNQIRWARKIKPSVIDPGQKLLPF